MYTIMHMRENPTLKSFGKGEISFLQIKDYLVVPRRSLIALTKKRIYYFLMTVRG